MNNVAPSLRIAPFVPASVPTKYRKNHKLLGKLARLGEFARMHKVQDKDSKVEVPFIPLPMQAKIFAAVEAGHKRIAVIKARQVSATTGCKMVLHHMAYVTHTAAMYAVVSMRADSAEALLDDHRRWLKHPPVALQRKLKTASATALVYEDTGAGIKAFTSRSPTGLRSFSPAGALLSEFAFAPDQEELLAQAISAVGEGVLIIESTANNPGDTFSKIVSGGTNDGWHVVTMWWHEHPAYSDAVPSGFVPTDAELQLQAKYDLTLGQLHWRRRKINELKSEVKFRREYPACLDDCFLSREGGYFAEEEMCDIAVRDFPNEECRELEAPVQHDFYVLGADVGGGVGGDYSTIAVISVATNQPVFMYRSNTIKPKAFAQKIVEVGSRYNSALVIAEFNFEGNSVYDELNACGYPNIWYGIDGKPWRTSQSSKIMAYDALRNAVQLIRALDRITYMEMRSLTVMPGKVTPEAPKGSHDDSSMALALAYRALCDIPSHWRANARKPPQRVIPRRSSATGL